MNEEIIQEIANYSKMYIRKHIEPQKNDKAALLNDHWRALQFLFSKIFYQGRRDEISKRVEEETVRILGDCHEVLTGQWTNVDISSIKSKLQESIGRGHVGKGGDVNMVINVLTRLLDVPDRNAVNLCLTTIRENGIKAMYDDLQKIHQIGPKIGALVLRDIVQIFELQISNEDAMYLQPVDTWVRQVVHRLGIVEEGASDTEIQTAIIRMCNEYHFSPLDFNQGAWYLGANAFEILLDDLSSKDRSNA